MSKPTYWDHDGPHRMHDIQEYRSVADAVAKERHPLVVKIAECQHCHNELWGEPWPGEAINPVAMIKRDDEIESTYQQWQCPCCGSWNDYPSSNNT